MTAAYASWEPRMRQNKTKNCKGQIVELKKSQMSKTTKPAAVSSLIFYLQSNLQYQQEFLFESYYCDLLFYFSKTYSDFQFPPNQIVHLTRWPYLLSTLDS